MRYKILKQYNGTNSYCEDCGKKNIPFPTGDFDTESGKPEAYLECGNLQCQIGKENLCKHNWERMGWILSLDKICKKCGAKKYDNWSMPV